MQIAARLNLENVSSIPHINSSSSFSSLLLHITCMGLLLVHAMGFGSSHNPVFSPSTSPTWSFRSRETVFLRSYFVK